MTQRSETGAAPGVGVASGAPSLFSEDLVFLDAEATTSDELFSFLSKKLMQKGYVAPSWQEAIQEREAAFPTGLAFETIALALPHVDAVHITKPYIAIVKPRTPILFSAMAGVSDEPILASLIVNLGLLKHNEQQVHVLSAMMEMFMDSAHVARIAAQTTQAGMVECFQSYLQL